MANIFGQTTPFTSYIEPRRNALMGAAAGLANGGLGGLWSGASQGLGLDRQIAEQQQAQSQIDAENNQTMEWIRQKYPQFSNLPADRAWALALAEDQKARAGGNGLMSVGGHIYDTNSGQWISPPEEAANRQNVSLSGQWGYDQATQQPVYLQPSSTGEFVQAQVPAGVSLLGPYDVSADRAAGSAFGKNTGAAQFDLPAAQLTTQQTLQAIENVRQQAKGMEEQFGNILGVPQQLLPTLPQSERAKFQVETNRLINRTFLEAREVLRGGGQITDFESRKAEGAISNLEEAMTRGDKALFEKSLKELEEAVSAGYTKLQAQAGTMGGYGNSPSPRPQVNSGTTSSGVPWSISGQ